MVENSYEEIEHTADIGLLVTAKTWPGLLIQAAQGMFALMGVETLDVQSTQRIIHVNASDREGLLVQWLEELLFLIETNACGIVGIRFISVEYNRLTAELSERDMISPPDLIKAVTYHDLSVQQINMGWSVKIVFDV
jgi:SHS2 domain-containing protein